MQSFQRINFNTSKVKAKKESLAGFTLMEIMVASVIFVIIIGALLSLFNYVLKINRRSEALRQASQGMRNFVEFLVKEVRNGQVDYGVVDPGGSSLSSSYPIGPCYVPSTAVTSGTATYSNQENKLAIVNTDNVEECIYFAKDDAGNSYVDNIGSTPSTFTAPAGSNYVLVMQKAGLAPQILNPPNSRVEKLMFIIRPQKDPYVVTGGLAKVQPTVVMILKFVVQLPTGEQVPIYYQTSVSSSKYDIPSQ